MKKRCKKWFNVHRPGGAGVTGLVPGLPPPIVEGGAGVALLLAPCGACNQLYIHKYTYFCKI